MYLFSKSLLIIILIKLSSSEDSLVVRTTLGKIKGQYRSTAKNVTYEAYEGIPYAEPPIKDNRFLVRKIFY